MTLKEREQMKLKVRDVFMKLKERKIRAEQVAVALSVSHSAIEKWISGERCPRPPILKLMESVYGVKIL